MSVARQIARLIPVAGARQELTIDATAGGLQLTTPTNGMVMASLRLETAQIRFTVDGSAPTAGAGRLMEVGEVIELESWEEAAAFKAIRTGAVSGVLDVEYFQEGAAAEASS